MSDFIVQHPIITVAILTGIHYFVFLTMFTVIFIRHSLRRRNNSHLDPCYIHKKADTDVNIGMWTVLVITCILSIIETVLIKSILTFVALVIFWVSLYLIVCGLCLLLKHIEKRL